MTEYERIRIDQRVLRLRALLATLAPAVVLAGIGGARWVSTSVEVPLMVAFVLVVAGIAAGLHWLLSSLSTVYEGWVSQLKRIGERTHVLRRAIKEHRARVPARAKRQHFKSAYEVLGRRRQEIEAMLAVGMYRERKEVFVTVFMREGTAVRRTASIGSPYRCRPADNPALWPAWAQRLGCDEILQYHNHPEHRGRTRPSEADVRTSKIIEELFAGTALRFRSLIIFWNEIGEWKVIEYGGTGNWSLAAEADAAELISPSLVR